MKPLLRACLLLVVPLGIHPQSCAGQVDPFTTQVHEMEEKEATWRQAHREFVEKMDSLDTCALSYRHSILRLQWMVRSAFQARREYFSRWHNRISDRVASYREFERFVPREIARLRKDQEWAQRNLTDAIRRRGMLPDSRGDAAGVLDSLIATLKAEIQDVAVRIDQLNLEVREERGPINDDMKDLDLLNNKLAESAQKQVHLWDNLYETFISVGRIRCSNFQ